MTGETTMYQVLKRDGKVVDFAGRIALNDKGEEVFAFGKYRDRSVSEVFRTDPSYYAWLMNGDFPKYTKKIFTEIRLRDAQK